LPGGFRKGCVVSFGDCELEKYASVLEVAGQPFDAPDLLLEAGSAPRDLLRLFLVLPEPWCERSMLKVRDLGFQLGNVKGAPLAP